jgi:hypothetical protein
MPVPVEKTPPGNEPKYVSSKLELQSSEMALDYSASVEEVVSRTGVLDGARAWWIGLGLMLAAVTVPVLMTPVPPLTDYPNHLARCYLLAFGQSDGVLRQMFFAHWQIIPNMAVDLLLPALMHVVPPLVAGRIVLALCLLLPASGAVALSYAYFHSRSFWQLGAGFAAFNALFLMGFMNFELAIGIALWGAAAWVQYREKYAGRTVAFGVLVATLAFFFHMFGLCFYALLIGSYELSILLGSGLQTRSTPRCGAKRVALFALVLAAPLALYLASPLEKVKTTASWPHLWEKAIGLFTPFESYSSAFDVLTVAPLLVFLLFCLAQKRVRVSKAALICIVILFLTYIFMPRMLKGTYFMDLRLPAMMGFMMFAGFIPKRLGSRQRFPIMLAFAVLFVARIVFIADVWLHSQRDVRDVRQVIESLTPGSRVLAADVVCGDNKAWCASMPLSRRLPALTPTYWHLASFVLLDRHAFWPNIFAEAGKQPVVFKEPYADLQAVDSPPVNYFDLSSRSLTSLEMTRFPFLAGWTTKFDYVLVLNAEGAPDLDHFLPSQLQLVDHQGIAALFRIRK